MVAAAKGRRAPDFVFANANDEAYGLVMLDPQSSRWLLAHLGEVRDPFLRAMLWGAQWDLVRDARLAPAEFIASATRELPNESDEQIAAGVLGRLSRATSAYLSDAQRARLAPGVEDMLLSVASDAKASLRHSQEFSRHVRLGGDVGGRAGAASLVAGQRVDRRHAAAAADALVDRHASRRAGCGRRRRADHGGSAARYDGERTAQRVRRRRGHGRRPRSRPSTSIDSFTTRRSTKTG